MRLHSKSALHRLTAIRLRYTEWQMVEMDQVDSAYSCTFDSPARLGWARHDFPVGSLIIRINDACLCTTACMMPEGRPQDQRQR